MNILGESRDVVLYAWITKRNKDWIKKAAKKEGCNQSQLVDHIVKKFKESYVSKPRKSRGSN